MSTSIEQSIKVVGEGADRYESQTVGGVELRRFIGRGCQEWRTKDLDLGVMLEYDKAHNVRYLIDQQPDGFGVFLQNQKTPQGGRPGKECWLTEEEAHLLIMEARTPKAREIKTQIVRLFLAVKKGELHLIDAAELKRILAERDALIADLRRQLAQRPAPSLRPMDVAAAWCRAHLEAAQAPLTMSLIWPRYLSWAQENAGPLTQASLVHALKYSYHRAQGVTSAFYCAFRAVPLPVELPEQAQGSLPFAAAPRELDAAELADRALRLLTRNELPAFAVAEILGITETEAQAVLGPLAEASGLRAKVRAGKVFYSVDLSGKSGADLRDRVELAVYGKTETTMVEVAQALGLDPTLRAVQMQIGLALRDIGYERYRSGAEGRPYVYRKPTVN